MDEETRMSNTEAGKGETPWFLKLVFLAFILWAVYYLWKNVEIG